MAGPRPDNPYSSVPDAAPSTGTPNDYLTVRASPKEFGAQVGEGIESAGKNLQQGSQGLFQTGIKWLQLQGDLAANSASNDLATSFVNTEDQFRRQYRGQNAVAQLKPTVDSMQQDLNKRADQIQKDHGLFAREAYLRDARNFFNNSVSRLGSYVDTEAVGAARESWKGSLQAIDNQAILNRNDPERLSQNLQTKVDKSLLYAHDFEGITDPAAAQAYVSQETGKLLSDVAKSFASEGTTAKEQQVGLDKAVNFINQYADKTIPGTNTPYLSAETRNELITSLRIHSFYISNKVDEEDARGAGYSFARSLDGDYFRQLEGTDFSTITSGQVLHALSVGIEDKSQDPNALGPMTKHGQPAGLFQILPGTFHDNAHPGESFDNEKDRETVSLRTMDKYAKEYHNDPARMMVAWISGEGNVSDSSDPVPYKDGTITDRNNTTVKDYVEKGLASLYGGSAVAPRRGDLINANFDSYEQKLEQQAEERFPNRPDLQSQMVSIGVTAMRREVSIQQTQDRLDDSNVLNWALDNQVANVKDFDKAPPEVKEAWDKLEKYQKVKANDVINKLIKANSYGPSANYGTEFYERLSDVLTGTTVDPGDLTSYVSFDRNAALTNTGLNVLTKLIKANQDPGFRQAELQFFDRARSLVTGSNFAPGVKTPELDEKFSKYIASVLPKITAGLAQHPPIGASQLFNENDKSNFIGWPQATNFQTLTNQIGAQAIEHSNHEANKPRVYNSRNDLDAAVKDGTIKTLDQYKAIANKHPDWFSQAETKPSVPTATFGATP